MKNIKHIIVLFYVALILLFKVTGLHALSHHSDDGDLKDCEVCDIISTVSFIPLIKTKTTVSPKAEYFFLAQKGNAIAVSFVLQNKHLSGYLFTRPPPTTVLIVQNLHLTLPSF